MMKIRKSKGFTLIELMITVAIVGILAAIALPAYQDYTIRAQVSEAILLASGTKAKVEEWYAYRGQLPSDSFEADVACHNTRCGNFVDYIDIQAGSPGMVFARLGNDVNTKVKGYSIFMKARINADGNLSWECIGNMNKKYLPSSCTQHDTPQTIS